MKTKKTVFLTALLLSFVMTVGFAMADAPMIKIDSIPDLAFESFPQTYAVTVTISHMQNNLNALKDLTFTVNGATVYYDGKPYTGNDIRTSTTFSLPFNITGPGTYTISVSARHGGFKSIATQEVTIETFTPPPYQDPL